ncbi:UNVERIFIED_CONTAM: hypothetical protein GTU68_026157 [Idotea baltica]|nr:hypothetical protein [Idotea baltica]
MELVWNDEFDGNNINNAFWSNDNGTGCPNLCGWGNNELEFYRTQNTWVENGTMVLEAREEYFQGSDYTSGKVVSRDKMSVHYGRIDIRALMPKGKGIWPALWLLGINQATVGWPKCGEIDIMEMVGGNGKENTVSANAFWDEGGKVDAPQLYTLSAGTFADKYHVFSLLWNEQSLQFYVDDQLYHTIDISSEERNEFQKPFYMILNVAVGGNWPGSPDETTQFPTSMKVDYVRVFRFE